MSITEKSGFVERNFFTARSNHRLSRSSQTAGRPTLLHTVLMDLGTFFSLFFLSTSKMHDFEILTIDPIFRCE